MDWLYKKLALYGQFFIPYRANLYPKEYCRVWCYYCHSYDLGGDVGIL
jgi:hypothetical protein